MTSMPSGVPLRQRWSEGSPSLTGLWSCEPPGDPPGGFLTSRVAGLGEGASKCQDVSGAFRIRPASMIIKGFNPNSTLYAARPAPVGRAVVGPQRIVRGAAGWRDARIVQRAAPRPRIAHAFMLAVARRGVGADRVLDELHGILDLSHDHVEDRGGLIADIGIAGAKAAEIGNGPACRDIEVGFLLIAGRHEEKDQEDPEGSSDEKHDGACVTQWNRGLLSKARLSNRQAVWNDFNKIATFRRAAYFDAAAHAIHHAEFPVRKFVCY